MQSVSVAIGTLLLLAVLALASAGSSEQFNLRPDVPATVRVEDVRTCQLSLEL
jgi:hypothetical protein